MDKVLVEVYIPVLGRSVEAFVPPELRGSEALALLKKAAADMSDGRFVPNEQTTLCRRSAGRCGRASQARPRGKRSAECPCCAPEWPCGFARRPFAALRPAKAPSAG